LDLITESLNKNALTGSSKSLKEMSIELNKKFIRNRTINNNYQNN